MTSSSPVTKGTPKHIGDIYATLSDQSGPLTAKAVRDGFASVAAFNITTSVTSAYTLVAADSMVRYDPTSGAFAITLLAASTYQPGTELVFKNSGTSANNMTLTAAGSDLIDGASTLVVAGSRAVKRLISNGVNGWDVC